MSSSGLNPIVADNYNEIDQPIKKTIDFLDDFERGLYVKLSHQIKGFRPEIEFSPSPTYVRGSLETVLLPNSNSKVKISVSNEQQLDLEINSLVPPFKDVNAKIYVNTATNRLQSGALPTIIGNISRRCGKYSAEAKATNKNDGLIGFSFLRNIDHHWSAGLEAYYKNVQKSGGASLAVRYIGRPIYNQKFQVCGTYNLMGDLALSFHTLLLSESIGVATRFRLNTNSLESNCEVGLSMAYDINFAKRNFPVVVNFRTSNRLAHGANIEFSHGNAKLNISTIIQDKKPEFGIKLCI
ncbi:hypothetical protein DFA_05074 [Cavenderia fasciculata]|uniref:Translocase of outer mitochondrial membrane n=1 Tax=Cavenderia fasciculata TaxID=261658 RepID=F4PN91_CACFS|nr:uncharacterized protein DFA_05074 [Cavenderia fasciculata]EGG22944.1 hypothetical protein DFA_05074 [Cavenderia fasciculata]|eukprot:XP_004360795.1 hypothetical protein DFA_05074 [Cavenderia fasciculata]